MQNSSTGEPQLTLEDCTSPYGTSRRRIRMLTHEQQALADGFTWLIGVDEAGRGPLAGPVVAAAVHLKKFRFKAKINDSKQLTPEEREEAFHEIFNHALVGVGVINEIVIDEHNILQATFFAMTNAVHNLCSRLPQAKSQNNFVSQVCLLVDGNCFKTDLPYASRTIVSGDNLSLSIACASIVAKVTRDRMLVTYDKIFPQYGFAQHKGYSTPDHRAAIQKHGLSSIHRKTFSWV